MIVSEAIDLVKDAELKQLKVKDEKTTILGYLNLGILEIYKRFDLWHAEAIITTAAGKTLYVLDGNDTDVTIDLSDHDLLMIQEMYDGDGTLMVLNDEMNPTSPTTPQFHQVEFAEVIEGQQFSVLYRAAPKFLMHEKQTIPLPQQFIEALFHYVGYRAHGSLKGDIKAENNTHYMRFEQSCNRVKIEGLYAQDDLVSTKFEDRGFV